MPYIGPYIGGVVLGVVLAAAAIIYYINAVMKPQRAQMQTQMDAVQAKLKELDAERERLQKQADTQRKELMLEARDEAHRIREEIDRETKEKRSELQRVERKLAQRDETLDEKLMGLDAQREALAVQERAAQSHLQEVWDLKEKENRELQRICEMSAEEAKTILFKNVEDQSRHEAAHLIQRIEDEAKAEGDKRARGIVTTAIQRIANDHVSETTVSVVPLPSDDVKGRIIGREGRNIRAFETLTGVDVIIDDTPEAVVLSSFDPVRREIARQALTALIIDGRIHPGRIEETVLKAQEDVDRMIKEAGERAVMETGVTGLHPEIVKLLGRMRYRTSYGQNLLDHSIEVCLIGTSIAAELGANVNVAKRASLLHDLGKIIPDAELPHALLSQEIMLRYGESVAAAHAAGAHHDEIPRLTVEDNIVQMADAISAARPGARREVLESYVKRLQKLEKIAEDFPGVEKTYAVQAGREIRLMVRPEAVDDASAQKLARDAARRIEEEMDYPGHIKVTVIRETRAIDYAK
jgi:ribonuclease Y